MKCLSVIKMKRFIPLGMVMAFFFLHAAMCTGCTPNPDVAAEFDAATVQRWLYRGHVDNGDKPGYWISLWRHNDDIPWGEFILTPPDSTKMTSYRRQIVVENQQDWRIKGNVDFTGPGRTPPNVDKIRIVFDGPPGKKGTVPGKIYWADGDDCPENDDGIDVSFEVTPLY